jgi:hypothetical protein
MTRARMARGEANRVVEKEGPNEKTVDKKEELMGETKAGAEKCGGMPAKIRREGRGRVNGESVYERRESSANGKAPRALSSSPLLKRKERRAKNSPHRDPYTPFSALVPVDVPLRGELCV